MLLQFVRFTEQQRLIKVALNKTPREKVKGLDHIPTRINAHARQATTGEERVVQVCGLCALRVVTYARRIIRGQRPELRHDCRFKDVRC